jgi:hypothetical protein
MVLRNTNWSNNMLFYILLKLFKNKLIKLKFEKFFSLAIL